MNSKIKWKEQLSFSNIITGILIVFVLGMLFSADFKGLVIQNLMKIGLFQPEILNSNADQLAEINANEENKQVQFKSPNEEIITLADQQEKVVFINFWATWCPPCIAEMPSIDKLYGEFRDHEQVTFLMVDVDNDRTKSQNFMDKRKFSLPVYTPSGPIPSSFMSGSIPTTLVLDKKGKVVFKHEGMTDFSNKKFKAFLSKLAAE